MEKKIKILVLVSVILIILGPVLGLLLNKVILVNQPVVIPDTSNSDMQDAYAFPITLAKGQKLVIEFSVYTADITAIVKIIGKPTYDMAYNDSDAPTGIGGESFVYSEFTYGRSPTSYTVAYSVTSVSIADEGYYYIEFAGDTTGVNLRSIPGDYVVIVYGTNDAGTDVYFNIIIQVDGPGEIVGMLITLVGIGALVAIMVIGTMGYLKKTGRGLL